MESKTLIYGIELLSMLDGRGSIEVTEFEKECIVKGDELKELLKS